MRKIKHPISIQARLLWLLGLSLPILWFVISVLAALPLYQQISADDDDYLRQLAKSLVDDNNQRLLSGVVDTVMEEDSEDLGRLDTVEALELLDEQLLPPDFAFTIWDKRGQVVVNEGDKVLPYQTATQGFVDSDKRWYSQSWRMYYHTNPKTGETVAVAQTWRSRLIGMKESIIEQLGILLLTLPLLLAIVLWSVKRGLRPLYALTQTLNQRNAHDLAPVRHAVPNELQPLTTALNQLFERVSATMEREQRFTADAAHELRSPLTAIKVQANELAHHLSLGEGSTPSQEALQRIQRVTDRASHLIEQLLTLAQLDNHNNHISNNKAQPPIDWLAISETALQSVSLLARKRQVTLKREMQVSETAILPLSGDATLLTLLLRNLLDNAIRYGSHEDSQSNHVELILAADYISVRDHGQGISTAHLSRISERFFRPAGQTQTGSGLGLSIVERIAELHGLTVSLENHVDGGAVAFIRPKN